MTYVRRRRNNEKHSRYEAPAPYFQFPLELIGSVVLAALSLGARRVLDRLIVEHLKNAGKENGRFTVSYTQLGAHAGVHQKDVAGALAELVDLGLLVIQHGERPKGAARSRPNCYRLTFLPDYEGVWPSKEWRRFEPSDGADAKARASALARAKDVAHAARRRRLNGDRPLRTEEEAEASVRGAENLLERVGKGQKLGRPGNKQTRAALNEVNARRNRFSHGMDRPVAHGMDRPVKMAEYGMDRPVGPHGMDRPVPSTSLVHVADDRDETSTPDIDVRTGAGRRGGIRGIR